MDLYRGKEYFRWNTVDWAAVLETAMNYGWQPMGTGPPRGCLKKDWDGGNAYYGNEGQLFYARDTKNLGTALEIFLSGPETPQLTRSKRQREMLSFGTRLAGEVQDLAKLIDGRTAPTIGTKLIQKKTRERLDDDQRKYIKQFISFCRKGSFRIY